MFKPTLTKIGLTVLTFTLSLIPLFLSSAPHLLYLPVIEVFWIDALAQHVGIPVTKGVGVDCFPLIWPNVAGWIFIVLSVASSLAVHYGAVCLVARWIGSLRIAKNKGTS